MYFVKDGKARNTKEMEELIYQNTFTCSCGHRQFIPLHTDKIICKWCGKWVFRDKETEFKFRMKEKMNKEKNNDKV